MQIMAMGMAAWRSDSIQASPVLTQQQLLQQLLMRSLMMQ